MVKTQIYVQDVVVFEYMVNTQIYVQHEVGLEYMVNTQIYVQHVVVLEYMVKTYIYVQDEELFEVEVDGNDEEEGGMDLEELDEHEKEEFEVRIIYTLCIRPVNMVGT